MNFIESYLKREFKGKLVLDKSLNEKVSEIYGTKSVRIAVQERSDGVHYKPLTVKKISKKENDISEETMSEAELEQLQNDFEMGNEFVEILEKEELIKK